MHFCNKTYYELEYQDTPNQGTIWFLFSSVGVSAKQNDDVTLQLKKKEEKIIF
jgi:hypothetical protein